MPDPVVNYDAATAAADDDGAIQNARDIKIPFNKNDIKLWFTLIESKMQFAGLKRQWSKRQVLFSIEYKTMVTYCFLGQSPLWSPLFWYGRLFILGACPHLVYYFNLVAYLFSRPDKFLS